MVWILLCAAALLVLVCAIGVAVMPDPYQQMHYISPPATLSILLVAAAVFVSRQIASGIKTLLLALVLMLMNGAVTHATARAARIREHKRLSPHPREGVPIIGREPSA